MFLFFCFYWVFLLSERYSKKERKMKVRYKIGLLILVLILLSAFVDVALLSDFVCRSLGENGLLYLYFSRNLAEIILFSIGLGFGYLLGKRK